MVTIAKEMRNVTKALHLLYNDKATIVGQAPTSDGPFDDTEPVVIAKDLPAKVILGGLKSGDQSEFLTDGYDAKLLIDVGIEVPAGAEITVTDINGKVTHYKRASRGYSGYGSHQEVAMVIDQKA